VSKIRRPSWPYLFLTVSGLGLCGKIGKRTTTMVSYAWKKRLGDKRKPLATLFVPLLEEAAQLASWPSNADMLADFALIQRWATEQVEGNRKAIKAEAAGGES